MGKVPLDLRCLPSQRGVVNAKSYRSGFGRGTEKENPSFGRVPSVVVGKIALSIPKVGHPRVSAPILSELVL